MSPFLQTRNAIPIHEPRLVPLGLEHLPILRYILAKIERSDLYSVSPSYFALTGRKGLWMYGDEKRGMLVARHPNIPDILLLFPPFGLEGKTLIDYALADKNLPKGKIQIARLAPEDNDIAEHFERLGMIAERERKLDWVYPVHSLDINSVVSHQGDKFKDFRKNLNRAQKRNVRSVALHIEKHDIVIRDLILKWAMNYEGGFSIEDLTMPTHMALYLKRSSSMPIYGVIILEDDLPVAFTMWEETRPEKRQAAGLCNASISSSKGISEYTYFEMCRILQTRGYNHVCIGGSEEEGLDAFKRKMVPEYSTELKTIILTG